MKEKARYSEEKNENKMNLLVCRSEKAHHTEKVHHSEDILQSDEGRKHQMKTHVFATTKKPSRSEELWAGTVNLDF